jgi:hypothetical protein
MKQIVKMFQPRFAALVKAGKKTQTVRKVPKTRMPEVGDELCAAEWSGKPYRSKQRVLMHGIITEVEPITIEEDYITVNTNSEPCESFAKADGFTDFHDMIEWFKSTHSLPFEGILIKWKPL